MGLREKQKAERREQILDAARRLIRATGGTEFSMRRLATEAEVGLVTPYNLFGSKSGVLYALLNAALERLDRVVDVRSPRKPVDTVLELADRAAEIYARDAAFYRPLMQYLLGVRDREHRPRALEHSLRLWSRTVEAAVRGGLLPQSVDQELLARQLLIGFIGVVELWIHEEFDDDEFRAQSMYGSALLVLAHAAPGARPRLLARLRALERRLPRRLANQPEASKHARRRPRAA
ncbi:MAG TPA: TetR/AcrR family transcriptional regulator [Myxococcota bacterium]|nr:TetR/AcrR family transcriptional regulator [Myxococcota bacterium]